MHDSCTCAIRHIRCRSGVRHRPTPSLTVRPVVHAEPHGQAEDDSHHNDNDFYISSPRTCPYRLTLPSRVDLDKLRKAYREGKRMVSGLTRNQVPGNRLRVRIPCPPLTYVPKQWAPTTPSQKSFYYNRSTVPREILRGSAGAGHGISGAIAVSPRSLISSGRSSRNASPEIRVGEARSVRQRYQKRT
jgi:hypothetical protein